MTYLTHRIIVYFQPFLHICACFGGVEQWSWLHIRRVWWFLIHSSPDRCEGKFLTLNIVRNVWFGKLLPPGKTLFRCFYAWENKAWASISAYMVMLVRNIWFSNLTHFRSVCHWFTGTSSVSHLPQSSVLMWSINILRMVRTIYT